TSVRRKVAKFELIPSTPILAKIAVKAAKSADNKAKNSQLGFGDATDVPRQFTNPVRSAFLLLTSPASFGEPARNDAAEQKDEADDANADRSNSDPLYFRGARSPD